jgi:CubicO group peptidase (beta-lactamase class C family)
MKFRLIIFNVWFTRFVQPKSLTSTESEILKHGVSNKIFPGAVAATGSSKGMLFSTSVGRFSYDDASPPMSASTVFDLASLTKVIATTSAVALMYEQGLLQLDSTVSSILGPSFVGPNSSKAFVSIEHCLTHTAGFAPDPLPWYWDPEFGCPIGSSQPPSPTTEDFRCLPLVYSSLLSQPITTEPGEAYLYSDFSFITLQFVVGNIALKNGLVSFADYNGPCTAEGENADLSVASTCAFEAFVRKAVFSESMPSSTYLLDPGAWDVAAPTLNDTTYTLRTPIQGQVSDGDAFAMGGIAGHAGLFAPIADVASFAAAMLRSYGGGDTGLLNETTVRTFVGVRNSSMSSRALGWDTNLHEVNDFGFDGVCGRTLSESTFLHIGYSGTCLCIDPENDFWSVILTNRVFNCQVLFFLSINFIDFTALSQ